MIVGLQCFTLSRAIGIRNNLDAVRSQLAVTNAELNSQKMATQTSIRDSRGIKPIWMLITGLLILYLFVLLISQTFAPLLSVWHYLNIIL